MPTRSSDSLRIVRRVRASLSTWTPFLASASGMSWSSSWLPRMAWTPYGAVTAEHDQIRVLGHQQADGAGDVFVRDETAAVDVGHQADAQAGERARQTANGDALAGRRQLVAAVEVPVRSRSRHCADAGGEQCLQDRAP